MHRDRLISSLYAAASGRSDWQAALTGIADALDAWVVQIVGFDKRQRRLIFSVHGGHPNPQVALDYFRYYNTIDPRVEPAMALAPGQWMHCHRLFDDEFVKRSEFYQDFLIPYGGRYMSGAKLVDNTELMFMLSFLRATGKPPFDGERLEFAETLRHHCAEAIQNITHLRDTLAENEIASTLLSPFVHPMLLVDALGGIWHANPAARRLLEHGGLAREVDGTLIFASRAAGNAFTEALNGLELNGPVAAGRPIRRAFQVRDAHGGLYVAIVSAIRPESSMGAFGNVPHALLVLHDPHAGYERDAALVAECFDLTPAEAQVAVLLAEGHTPRTVSERRGVSLATVRSQVRSVTDKFGVARYTDVVRVLADLPVR